MKQCINISNSKFLCKIWWAFHQPLKHKHSYNKSKTKRSIIIILPYRGTFKRMSCDVLCDIFPSVPFTLCIKHL